MSAPAVFPTPAPEKPRPHRAELLALAVAMVFPTAMAWCYFRVLAGGGQVHPAQQFAYSLGKLAQFAFPLAWCRLNDRRWPRARSPRCDGLLWGVGFGLATAALLLGLFHGWLAGAELFAGTPDRVRDKLQEFGVTTPARYFGLAAFIVAVHSLLEEYYWRWFVFGRLRDHVPVGLALVVSSLAFMGHHVLILDAYFPGHFWMAVVPFSLGVAVGGAFWAWLYQRTGSLAACWLSHLLVDAAIFVLGWSLLGGTRI
jgi:membrane protease YdiL (CAAX protease family)